MAISNVVFIGPVSSGKSTLIGRMLSEGSGFGHRDTLKNYESELQEKGKDSMKYAWHLDDQEEERERGYSMDTKWRRYSLIKDDKLYPLILIDTPSHRDYVGNMIVGTTQAECGVLVVSAVKEEFEASIANDGMLKEQVLIAFSMRCKQIIVAVNKMDLARFSEKRFNETVTTTKEILKRCGYNPKHTFFIPVSGWKGDNVVEHTNSMPWFRGCEVGEPRPTRCYNLEKILVYATDNARADGSNKPLRIPISDVCTIPGYEGVHVTGCVESGCLGQNMSITIGPNNMKSKVGSLEGDWSEDMVQTNELVKFNLPDLSLGDVKRGYLVGLQGEGEPKAAKSFVARIKLFGITPTTISAGFSADVHCHTAKAVCVFKELTNKMDYKGKVVEEKPASVEGKDAFIVKLVPQEPICVEEYKKFPSIGRLLILSDNRLIGCGMVISIEY